LFQEHFDPAAGPNSPHIEISFRVCPTQVYLSVISQHNSVFQHAGPRVTGFVALLTPKSRSCPIYPLHTVMYVTHQSCRWYCQTCF
jgi:hypothetical protein